MSDSDVCRGCECCKMRPTQAMDDSGITQVLGLLSEPSLPTKKERGQVRGRWKEAGRLAGSVKAGIPKGAWGLSTPVPCLSWVSECQHPREGLFNSWWDLGERGVTVCP